MLHPLLFFNLNYFIWTLKRLRFINKSLTITLHWSIWIHRGSLEACPGLARLVKCNVHKPDILLNLLPQNCVIYDH